MVPAPLTEEHIAQLLRQLGRPESQAGAISRRTKGLPGRIYEALTHQMQDVHQLGPLEKRLLEAMDQGKASVQELALVLDIGEHAVVDIAERLVDSGIIEPVDNAQCVSRVV